MVEKKLAAQVFAVNLLGKLHFVRSVKKVPG